MGLMFGTQDHIDCLTNNTFDGPHGDQLCLASKISLHFFGAGVSVSDGGYVLKIKNSSNYYPVNADQLKALQAQGVLPTPLPPYHISTFQYAFGYSLWICIAIAILFWVLKKMFGKLAPFLAADVAPSVGPPMTRTDHDRWLAAELGKHLEPGERLQHQAIATNVAPGTVAKGAKMLYVALTDRRLLTMEALMGFTGRLKQEARDLTSRRRDEIIGAGRDELCVTLHFRDQTSASFWITGAQRTLTNQWLFARDVPKLVAAAAPAASTVQAVNAAT